MIEYLLSFFGNRTFGSIRSPHWPEVQKAYHLAHPNCIVCGTKGTLLNPINIHHLVPFHKDPTKELDPTNLRTLCRAHHFLFGHLMKWASWNVDLDVDARIWSDKIRTRP